MPANFKVIDPQAYFSRHFGIRWDDQVKLTEQTSFRWLYNVTGIIQVRVLRDVPNFTLRSNSGKRCASKRKGKGKGFECQKLSGTDGT